MILDLAPHTVDSYKWQSGSAAISYKARYWYKLQ